MAEAKVVMCSRCSGEVVAGTLFCWRHPASPPKVGEVQVDGGQLLWRTTGEASGLVERLLAVFLDGAQVAVRRVEEAPSARPPRLLLDVADPAAAGAAATTAYLPLGTLLSAVLDGDERVEATRIV